MTATITSAAFATLSGLLKARSGLVIGQDKIYLLETRLGAILRREKLPDLNALAEATRKPGAANLIRDVVEAMTTNESFFFRDDKPFQHFRSVALPKLSAARAAGTPLRIWSAASSSGQEAYSLAMILQESKPTIGDRRCEIIGTDIARDQLTRAKEALYTQFEVQRGLPIQLLMKHFQKEDTNWRLVPAIRSMVRFQEFNLLSDPKALGRFDVVFCRNVLIYFDQPTKTQVLEAIAAQMPRDGILYLGGAETVLGLTGRFAPLPGERGVYGLTETVTSVKVAAHA
jgi:chemotaxis protein methyltransferase CheR